MDRETKEDILKRRKEIEEELTLLLKETKSYFSLEHIKDVIYNEKETDEMQKIIMMFDNGDPSNLSNVLEIVSDAWNYFPHKALRGLSPADKLLDFEAKSNKEIQDKYTSRGLEFNKGEFFEKEDNEIYDYILPSGAVIDDGAVMDAMYNDTPNRAFFLSLAEGDVIILDMNIESSKKVYKEMNGEIYAYAQIPKLDLELSDDGADEAALQSFFNQLLVKVYKEKIEDDFFMEDKNCDCKICQMEKKCRDEGREPSMEEIKKAFEEARKNGGIVGGKFFDKK